MLKRIVFIVLFTICTIKPMDEVERIISLLTLEEKIAQLMIVAAVADPHLNEDFMKGTPYQLSESYLKKCIEKGVGGIIFLGASEPRSQHRVTQYAQELSIVPLFIAQDAEWGLSMRMKSHVTRYPMNMTLGAISEEDDELLYAFGKRVGEECKSIGLHINFAPVADVNNNPDNPIINARSFGENPQKVADKAQLVAQGMMDAGIMPCAKHFPGHGDTTTDSHHALPVITHSPQRLDEVELVPFNHLIKNGIPSIMTAHIALPTLIQSPDVPATLSYTVMTSLLEEKLKFNGLIVTDGLGMKGVTDQYQPGELEVKALQAGCDILLCPVDIERAINCIADAVRSGLLSEAADIDHKIRKVLRAKDRFLHDNDIFDLEFLTNNNAKKLKKSLFHAAITLVRKKKLPLDPKTFSEPLEIITFGAQEKPEFIHVLRTYTDLMHTPVDAEIKPEQLRHLLHRIKGKKNIITTIHLPNRHGMIELQEKKLPTSLETAKEIGRNNIVVLFGNPYNLKHFTDASDIIVAYEDDADAQEGAALAVLGKLNPRGSLPVTAHPEFREGLGLHY